MPSNVSSITEFKALAQGGVELFADQRFTAVSGSPIRRVSQSLPVQFQQASAQAMTPPAVAAMDRYCANAYWFMRLSVLLMENRQVLPISAQDVEEAVKRFRDGYLADAGRRQLYQLVTEYRFDQISQSDLERAKREGFIITDETWPFCDQEFINPIFCA